MFLHPLGIASDDPYRDNDWFTDRVFDVLARDAVLNHGQLPLRSHLVGGGYPTAGHPFDGSMSPTLLPVLAFGDVIGVKLVLCGLWLAAAWGCWGLTRRWMGLDPPAAAVGTLALLWSGQVPSMLLVGFYPQAFYLLTPVLLRLLWVERGPRAHLLAGAAFALLVGQAGNAAVAVAIGVALLTWATVPRTLREGATAALVLLGLTAPPAFARALESAWPLLGWAVPLGLLASPAGRGLLGGARPWVRRAALLGLVAGALAGGKLVALGGLLTQADYQHELSYGHEFWFPRLPHGEPDGRLLRWRFTDDDPAPAHVDPDFFGGPRELVQGLLSRAPTVGEYEPFPPPNADPMEERPLGQAVREYMWVGLTAPVLALALLGLIGGPRRGVLAAGFVGAAGICLGPHAPPDLHFLLVSGLPGGDSIVQPLKYFSFFLALLGALLAGGGAQVAQRWLPGRWAWAPLGLLAWPLLHNGSALAERFEHPVSVEPEAEFWQLRQVGHPSWVGLGDAEIDRRGRDWMLRELARPEAAREYVAAKRGVGVIDWYGTLTLPEAAVPRRYVTPSGARIDNPDWRGEAWLLGPGEVTDVAIGPTRIAVTLDADTATRLVVNQQFLPGFRGDPGPVQNEGGLLALDVESGPRTVHLQYRPWGATLGLLLSLVAWMGWAALLRRSGSWNESIVDRVDAVPPGPRAGV